MKDTKSTNKTVVKTATEKDRTTVHYSDGTRVVHMHSATGTGAGTSASKTTGNKSTATKSHGTSTGNYHGSTGGSWYATSQKAKLAFEAYGIEFWGAAKSKLDDVKFSDGDLIINCTGYAWAPIAPKPFTKTVPEWMSLPEIYMKATNGGEKASQLLLDWPDFKEPPEDADIDFWLMILNQARENNVTRIICCCQAGQGRTGTALSALLLATGAVDEPDIAIDYIRKVYNEKAIESVVQEEYLFNLIYEVVAEPETADDEEEDTQETGEDQSHSKRTL